jgi:nitroreductase
MKNVLIFTSVLAAMLISCCPKTANQEVVEQKNETMETIFNRRSIRAYTQESVSQSALDTIVLAAINAPSARNLQPWQMRVITNRALVAEIESGILAQRKAENPNLEPRPAFHGAPVLLAVACEKANPFGQLDCGWFGQNILLAAHSLGLGTCVVANANGYFNSEYAKNVMAKLNFSEGYEIIYVIALGHPAEAPQAKPRDASKVKFVE